MHIIIQDEWFRDADSVGLRFPELFSPIREVTLAIVFTAVRLPLIDVHPSERPLMGSFRADPLLPGPVGEGDISIRRQVLGKSVQGEVRVTSPEDQRLVWN